MPGVEGGLRLLKFKLSWSVPSLPNMLVMLLCKHSGLPGTETSHTQ